MALERTYTVPLRREWLRVPRYRRAKKAAKALREFLVKHMKSADVKLGRELNLELWAHGMRNPPHHVKVSVQKDEKGVVHANLYGKPVVPPKPEAKPKKAAPKADAKKDEAPKAAEKPAEKKAEAKPAEQKAAPKKEAAKKA